MGRVARRDGLTAVIVLASTSPRRRALLKQLGVAFVTDAAAVDERRLPGENAAAMTLRLALLKAHTVFERRGDGAPTLAGDTVVAVGDEVFGKPADAAEAAAMLRRLSGRTHRVLTAVALVTADRRRHRQTDTAVTFADLADAQIKNYCDTIEPFDKAGGYAIQGAGGAFVTRVAGSYSGVVGLPLHETAALLRELDSPAADKR